jgi:hypothetical protein
LIDGRTHAQDFLGVQVDIGGLAAEAAHPRQPGAQPQSKQPGPRRW